MPVAMDMKAARNMIAEEEDDEVPGEPFVFILYCTKIMTNIFSDSSFVVIVLCMFVLCEQSTDAF